MVDNHQINIFDPWLENPRILPNDHGIYFIALKNVDEFYDLIIKYDYPSIVFPYIKNHPVIYVGISSKQGIRERDYGNHFNGTARSSTLRKSLGSLFFENDDRILLPNDRYRYNDHKENDLSKWMKQNLMLFYLINHINDRDLREEETKIINKFSPPLNIQNNHSPINREFREYLKELRKI